MSVSPSARADRPALAALGLLAVALHARNLLVGFPDDDLRALDSALSASLAALLRGGALPGGFTPVSRELYLWWWGNVVGLGPLGFHLVGAAIAVATMVLLYRLVERWAGARAGVIAAGWMCAFAPLGTMLSSVLAARDLIALFWCAGALLFYTRGLWIPAGLAAGLAALSRETAALIPAALGLCEVLGAPRVAGRQRIVRLAPAFLAVAGALVYLTTVAPGGFRLDPGRIARLPLDLARAWVPPGTLAGLGAAWRAVPWLVLGVAGCALLAVPRGSGPRAKAGRPGPAGVRAGLDPAILLGAGLALLGLLPAAFVPGPPAAEVFAVAALGLSIAIGAWLAARSPWIARALLAAVALAGFGANSAIVSAPPAPGARGAAGFTRFASHASLAAQAARTAPILAALQPLRVPLAAVPHTFAAGIPPDSSYRLALGAGARVTLHDPRISIRFLAEFAPADTATPFGVLHYDAARGRFVHDRADARVRARIGEGLLLYARYDAAAACFASAAAAQRGNRELGYPWVVSLMAAGRAGEGAALRSELAREGLFPTADTLAARLMTGYAGAAGDSMRRVAIRLAAAVVADPAAAPPHLALGRHLLAAGRARAATLEFAAASGISHRSQDYFWLARGYDALGVASAAFEAYRAALAGGLDSLTYPVARARMVELMRSGVGPAR